MQVSADTLVRSIQAPFFRNVGKDHWTVLNQELMPIGMVRRNGGPHYEAYIGDKDNGRWHGSFRSRRQAGMHVFKAAEKAQAA